MSCRKTATPIAPLRACSSPDLHSGSGPPHDTGARSERPYGYIIVRQSVSAWIPFLILAITSQSRTGEAFCSIGNVLPSLSGKAVAYPVCDFCALAQPLDDG